MTRLAVIGIDPGAHSAAALLTVCAHPALIRVETHDIDGSKRNRFQSPTQLVSAMVCQASAADTSIVGAWLEGQFVGINPCSAIALARTAGRWQEACCANGLACTIVEPATWQARELRERRILGGTKRAAIAKCAALYRIAVSEHAADAILIARYAAIEAWDRARQERLL